MMDYLRPNWAQDAASQLSYTELAKADEWVNEHACRNPAFYVIAHQTGIGTKFVVRCENCKNDTDVTDYSSW